MSSSVIAVVSIVLVLLLLLVINEYYELKKLKYNNQKDIELRRLEVLEKFPELRNVILNQKINENDKK